MNTSNMQKSVRFNDNDNQILSIDRIAKCYMKDVFYTTKEIQSMNNKIRNDSSGIIKKISIFDENMIKSRCMEKIIDEPACKNKTRQVILKSIKAVMKEQSYQRTKGIYNPDAMAKIYLYYGAAQSQQVAIEIGQHDYEESLRYIDECNTSSTKSRKISMINSIMKVLSKHRKAQIMPIIYIQ